MRVLHILGELNPSGAEVMLCASAELWKKQGISIDILGTGEVIGPYGPRFEANGFKIHHLPFAKSFRFFYEYYRLLRRERYDVVHNNSERANFQFGLIAWLAGTPRIVRTLHNVFLYEGRLKISRQIQRAILRKVGVLHLSIGESVAENEESWLRNSTVPIANWYDDRKFTPATESQRGDARTKLDIDEETFVVVSVGNCSAIKNHEALLEALGSLKKELDFLYLHLGREDQYPTERALAQRLGISDRVRFQGPVPNVLPYLWAADVYAMPSRHEGFSIAALEALSVGIPAVLGDVAGLKDLKGIVPHAALWVEPKAEAVATALRAIAPRAVHLRCDEGPRTYQTLSAQYGMEAGVARLVSIYRGTPESSAEVGGADRRV